MKLYIHEPVLLLFLFSSVPAIGTEFAFGKSDGLHQIDQRGGNSHGAGREASHEKPQETILIHGFSDALIERVSEAQKRYSRPGSGEIPKGLIDPQEA